MQASQEEVGRLVTEYVENDNMHGLMEILTAKKVEWKIRGSALQAAAAADQISRLSNDVVCEWPIPSRCNGWLAVSLEATDQRPASLCGRASKVAACYRQPRSIPPTINEGDHHRAFVTVVRPHSGSCRTSRAAIEQDGRTQVGN